MSRIVDEMVAMRVVELAVDPLSEMPLLVLQEIEGSETLIIWIGLVEASSIASYLQNVRLQRPMTHDLMKSIIEGGGLKLARVEVRALRDNCFHASVVIEREGREVELDARPSDAVALALRSGAPILVSRRLIDQVRPHQPAAFRRMDCEAVAWEGQPDPRCGEGQDMLALLAEEDFGKWKM